MGNNAFVTKKVKLELALLLIGNLAKLSTGIFAIEEYYDFIDINSDHDRVKLAITNCKKDALN